MPESRQIGGVFVTFSDVRTQKNNVNTDIFADLERQKHGMCDVLFVALGIKNHDNQPTTLVFTQFWAYCKN